MLKNISPKPIRPGRYPDERSRLVPAIGLHSASDAELRTWIEMNRRQLIALFGGIAAGLPTMTAILAGLDSDERGRIAQVVAQPGRVDAQAVDHIETALEIALSQNDAYGPRAVLAMVLAQRAITSSLLSESPPHLRSRLLTLHGRLSQLAGWMLFDLQDFAAAANCYELARESAHHAGDEKLVVLVLCNMSYMATRNGSPRTGIDHAVAAQNWASNSGDPLLHAYADEVAAIAYATDSNDHKKRCLKALDSAHYDIFGAELSSERSLARFNGPGFLASFKSECMLKLGQAENAQQAALDSLAQIDTVFVRNRALAYLDLANAHIAAHEIDNAAKAIGESAVLAASCRSSRLVESIHQARSGISTRHGNTYVRELDDLLASYELSNLRT